MQSQNVGRWSAVWGKRTYAEEMKHAVVIGAEWRSNEHQIDIVVDDIPGWLSPLWGSDANWLYLRRPEGIWKTEIPDGVREQVPTLLCQQKNDEHGARVIGCLSIGSAIRNQTGWHAGYPESKCINAFELDEICSPSTLGAKVEADAIGQELWDVLLSSEDQVLVKAGDDFCEPPEFTWSNEWLIARDSKTGWRIAYPLEIGNPVHSALFSGNLWLQFRSPWLRAINARVMKSGSR